ncbi:unnamed protein product [Thlaspi arvense]|uniref:NTF2 domain-containing protein n=1 Tax=Thlaspi arvense TaxID=13288 RepID=A0AAU9RS27_THLAR|nr:unnamed protein product [Thlaspi arvense]
MLWISKRTGQINERKKDKICPLLYFNSKEKDPTFLLSSFTFSNQFIQGRFFGFDPDLVLLFSLSLNSVNNGDSLSWSDAGEFHSRKKNLIFLFLNSLLRVGSYFVGQYYQVLQQQPDLIHQFYSESSKAIRIDGGSSETANTLLHIHNMIMSLNFTAIEVKTINSSESWEGGVLVAVSGSVITREFSNRRSFVQTFFLAPQEKGYFVHNDIFQFVDEGTVFYHQPSYLSESKHEQAQLNPPSPPHHEPQVPDYVLEQEARDYVSAVQIKDDLVDKYSLQEEQHHQPQHEEYEDEVAVEEAPREEVVVDVVHEPRSVQAEEPVGEKSKMSYASILRVAKEAAAVPVPVAATQPLYNKNSQDLNEWDQPLQTPSPQVAAPQQPNASSPYVTDYGAEADDGFGFEDFEIKSVYVRNLPSNISASEIEDEFKNFGTIKPDGVFLRTRKFIEEPKLTIFIQTTQDVIGVCYAFVEYEDMTSVENAIKFFLLCHKQASPIYLGGRQVYVEERRPNPAGVRGARRGGGVGGRGRGGYPTEATRGRFGSRVTGRGNQEGGQEAMVTTVVLAAKGRRKEKALLNLFYKMNDSECFDFLLPPIPLRIRIIMDQVASSKLLYIINVLFVFLKTQREFPPLKEPETFSLPVSLPQWPSGQGFASSRIKLCPELEVAEITTFEFIWRYVSPRDKNKSASFYKPDRTPDGFHCLGHYSQSDSHLLRGFLLVARELVVDSQEAALVKPLDYTLVWTSNDLSEQEHKHGEHGYFWLPQPPRGYKPIGFLVTTSSSKPELDQVRCVRADLTDKCEPHRVIVTAVSDSLSVPLFIWKTRPSDRGMWGKGVSVGTFHCAIATQDQDQEQEDLACLKSLDSSLHAMPNIEQIHALVQHYGPRVFFHPDEVYLPSSVSWFFKNGAVLCSSDSEFHEPVDENGNNLPHGGSNDKQFWIDLPRNDEEKCRFLKRGDIANAKLYVHVKPAFGGTFTDLAFWIFCPFNGPATLKLGIVNLPLVKTGQHVCDWEHFTLRVSNFSGELYAVYFSQHSGGEWIEAQDLEFPPWLGYMREWGPKIVYGSRTEIERLNERLPWRMRCWVNAVLRKLPVELSGEEGPTGPKEKNNWFGDERW